MLWVNSGSGFRNVKDVLVGEYLKVMVCQHFLLYKFFAFSSTSMAQACRLTRIIVEGEDLLVVAAVTQHQAHLACC